MDVSQQASRFPIAYWIFNYTPKWEAASMEVATLASAFRESFGTRINCLNLRGQRFKLSGHHKILPLPYALIGLPLVAQMAKRMGVNHVFASPAEWLLTPLLARLKNTVLTIAKDNPSLDVLEKNIPTLKALRCIVVESERHHDLMMQVGIPASRIKLIYPGVAQQPYRPAQGPFTILYATSPFGSAGFLSRGVYLMLQTAKLLPDVRFRLVWRGDSSLVQSLINDARLTNVEVISGFVENMGELYDASHATILPALSGDALKPCPHSGLHALAHGKPLLVSTLASLSGVVERKKCGVVFEPTIESLKTGIQQLMAGYEQYQSRAHPVANETFSPTTFIERYRKLYTSLIHEQHPVKLQTEASARS